MNRWNDWLLVGTMVSVLGLATPALADVRLDGDWSDNPKVSVHVDRDSKGAALAQVAKAAGWSLVLHTSDLGGNVTVDVVNVDAKDVVESVLADGTFVANRRGEGGKLLEVSGARGAVPDAADRKRDRAVLGHDLRVEKGETVGDVSVTGGSAEIYGTVDGDLVVTGGTVTVHEGGHVTGNALAVGGRIRVERGGSVDGDHKVIGGVFDRDAEPSLDGDHGEESFWTATKRRTSEAFGNFAFLFVLGALFLATAPDRMQRLRTAFAARPLASVAHGLGGLIGSIAAIVMLCLTVVGIPFAILFVLLGALAVTGALAATLTTAGEALLGHRSKNPYVHLALGSAIYALSGLVPVVGGFVQLGLFLAAVGILVSTRVAGYVRRKEAVPVSDQPYR